MITLLQRCGDFMMGKNKRTILLGTILGTFLFLILGAIKTSAYNITYDYDSNGGTTVQLNESLEEYNENDEVNLSAVASKDGWTFVGWTMDSDGTTPLTTLTMPANDVVLYAIYRYEAIEYTLTLNAGYATISSDSVSCTIPEKYNNETIVTSCEVTTPVITPVENFDVVGFGENKDDSSSKVVDHNTTYQLSSNQSLTAIIKREFEITFIINTAKEIPESTTGNKCEVNSLDDTCIIQSYDIKAKDGYKVAGWNISPNLSSSSWGHLENRTFTGSMSNSYDNVFYAITPAITYTIQYNVAPPASIVGTEYDIEYTADAEIDLPDVGRYGYTFEGWKPEINTGNWNTNEQFKGTVPAGKYGEIKLVAVLEPIEIKLNFDAQGGTLEEPYRMVDFNSKIGTLPIPTRPGFIFISWYQYENYTHEVDETTSLAWTNEETTIYAKWDIKEIAVGEVEKIEKIYDGTASQVTVAVSHESSEPLTFKWYKYNDKTAAYEHTNISNTNTLSIKDVKDNGAYYLEASIDVDNLFTHTFSEVINVNISPKNIQLVDVIPVHKVYDGSKRASLTGGRLVGIIEGDSVSFSLLTTIILPKADVGIYPIIPSASLTGAHKDNYAISETEELNYHIKSETLKSGNEIITYKYEDGFQSNYRVYFSNLSNKIDSYEIDNTFGKDYFARKIYQIKIVEDEKTVNYENVTVKVKLSKKLKQASKYKVLVLGSENVVKDCKYKDGYLTFEASSSVTFAIFSDKYMDYTGIIILSILLVSLMMACAVLIIKQTNFKIHHDKKVVSPKKEETKKVSVHEKYLKLDEENKENKRKQKLENSIIEKNKKQNKTVKK